MWKGFIERMLRVSYLVGMLRFFVRLQNAK